MKYTTPILLIFLVFFSTTALAVEEIIIMGDDPGIIIVDQDVIVDMRNNDTYIPVDRRSKPTVYLKMRGNQQQKDIGHGYPYQNSPGIEDDGSNKYSPELKN